MLLFLLSIGLMGIPKYLYVSSIDIGLMCVLLIVIMGWGEHIHTFL